MSLALKTLYGAVASAVLFSSAAYAAGLGKLTVLSALGQPLRAEIELTAVSNEEASGLVAKLAPPDAFKLANIEFNPALLSLHFAVEQRNSRQYIKITSSQPVNEPFVDMLLELTWSSGRLVREYTFLLDPAELRATQPAQVAAAAPSQSARTPAPAAPQPQQQAAQPARPKAERQEGAAAAPASQSAASQYKVKPGDTLGRIAAQVKPVDVSLDMMLVALFRANPDSFVGNNMNRLKSGQILSVPDSDAIKGGGEAEARGVVVAHAADFNAYRNKLAGQVANAAPAKAPETGQSAAGKITAKVEERSTAANESKDQLKLSKAAAGKNAASAAEDTIAKDRALADAAERVKELERNVNDLEKLMVVKSRAGSGASKTAVADVTTEVKPSVPAAETGPAPLPATPAAPVAATPPKKVVLKQAPAPAAPTLADTLMDNITAIGAGAAVLLLALFGLSRRKKRGAVAPTEPSILGAPTDQAHSLFAETGGQSVDTSNSVFNSSFSPSASQLDTNEVDPVAEADVYIAYGRDVQAEEILKEALRTHPERYPVRLKLLEIYAARKDQRAFETQAGEMYGMTRGQGDDWAQAAALGLAIDPLNPLYASAADAPALAPAASAEAIAEQAILNQMHDEGLSAGDHLLMDLDGNRLDALLAQEETIVAVPAAEQALDDHTLDFDLGGLDFEPLTSTQPSAPAAADPHDLAFSVDPIAPAAAPNADDAAKEQDQSFDLAFDLAFDAPAAPNLAPASAPAPAAEPKSLDDMRFDLTSNDLSLDSNMAGLAQEFDLPKLPEPERATSLPADASFASFTAPAVTPAADPLAEFDAMDFDLPAAPKASASTSASAHATAPADDPFALPEFSAPPAAAPNYAQAPQFDMAGIDLDLPADFMADSSTHSPAGGADAAPAMATATQADLSSSYMEMETKLDLAIAYQEIGDKEGARELLDEVIKGGSIEQVGKANDMRSKLD
jgi:pilus assembly protein FimV